LKSEQNNVELLNLNIIGMQQQSQYATQGGIDFRQHNLHEVMACADPMGTHICQHVESVYKPARFSGC
jgi:hypothetical protein